MPTFPFAGGVTSVAGWGQRNRIRFVGTWVIDDTWRLDFTTNLIGDFTVGEGNLAGAEYNFALVHADRVYIANGNFWSYSAVGDPTGWEQQDPGAGFQPFTSNYGVGDSANSLAIIQGRLAVFGRYNIQIWQVDANPANFARVQIIQNAGTISKDSVQSIGELDTYYLDDTGVRSLKTKEQTLNAYVDDAGSAIDKLVQTDLSVLSDSSKITVKGFVEPSSKRYWLYMPTTVSEDGGYTFPATGKFYVLSNFPSSKVHGWSTYLAVGSDGFAFVPYRLMLYQNKVMLLAKRTGFAGNALRLYLSGGESGEVYDTTVPTVDLPWIDVSTPGQTKQGCGLHAAFKGKWSILASMNPRAASMTEVVNRGSAVAPDSLNDSTYDIGHFNYSANGTHVHLKAVGVAAEEAQVLSLLTLLYNESNKQ